MAGPVNMCGCKRPNCPECDPYGTWESNYTLQYKESDISNVDTLRNLLQRKLNEKRDLLNSLVIKQSALNKEINELSDLITALAKTLKGL